LLDLLQILKKLKYCDSLLVNIRKDLDLLFNLYLKLVDKILIEEELEKEYRGAIADKGGRELMRKSF